MSLADPAPISRLELTWATRHNWELASAVAQDRRYLDFVIDGRSLLEAIGGGDLVTPFGWLPHFA